MNRLLQEAEAVAGFFRFANQFRRFWLTGKEENLAPGNFFLEENCQFDSRHALHLYIGNNIVGRFSSCGFECHSWIGVRDGIEQMHLQDDAQHLGDANLVVDDENARMRQERIAHAVRSKMRILCIRLKCDEYAREWAVFDISD
jgi:hypothetical protein